MTLPLALFMSLSLSQGTAPVALLPTETGDIVAWLVAGPYPNEGALQLRGTGFATDYLAGEAKVDPKEGDANGVERWRLAVGRNERGIDLNPVFRNASPGIGYAFTDVISSRAQDAVLLFGSDDGAKVYLNGVKVFEKQIARGIKRDEERIPIRLVEGENRLLFKIEQGDGGWGLVARIVDEKGQTPPGLRYSLDLQPNSSGEDPLAWLHRLGGKPGTVNVFDLTSYWDARERVRRWIDRFESRGAANPDRVRRALDLGARALVAASDDATSASAAAHGATLAIETAYTAARAPLQAKAQNPAPLFPDVRVASQDWVRPMPGGRYFVTGKGTPFLPLGYNHNPDWPPLEFAHLLHDDYRADAADKWFAKLKAHGLNLVRLMVETPPSGNVEEKPGTFRYEHMLWLDQVVKAARKHGIRLMVTPYDTFWMNLRAETSPYWAENGGPIREKIQFITDPKLRELQKGRMRWLIDRYGNLDTIFCWEIMNEIDLWWGATPEQIRTWADDMAKYVLNYQRQKWGRGPMLSMSMAEPMPKGAAAENAFRRPDLDFATMHLYIGASRAPNPGEEEKAADDFASGVVHALAEIRDNRPVFDGESGPIDRWVPEEDRDNRLYHEMSWAHLMAGGAGPGLRWPYRGPHHLTEGMLDTLAAMRKFVDGVPWSRLNGAMVKAAPVPPEGWRVRGFATAKGAIYRVQNRGQAGSLTVPGATRIRPFDIGKGEWLPAKSGDTVKVAAETGDLALYADR
jgi:mannan endo-1,4-beta-mannosidase